MSSACNLLAPCVRAFCNLQSSTQKSHICACNHVDACAQVYEPDASVMRDAMRCRSAFSMCRASMLCLLN